jgi:hypothetical protein
MEIKHKASLFVAMIIGGILFLWLSIGIMWSMKEFHILMGLLTLLGAAMSFFGVHGVLTRDRNLIIINEHGISQFKGDTGGRIHVSEIEMIKPFADISGRGVAILLANGEIINFDCRHYCSVKKFIKYCKKANLPCA